MVRIEDLEFRYRHDGFRLAIPSLETAPGEHVAIIGPSGSGKTTLLKLIAGIIRPHRGSIFVDGKRIDALADPKRRDFRISRIGFVFQDFGLLDYLNVIDNILLPFRISGALKLDNEVRERAVSLAIALEIDAKLFQYAGELSQGEKQRAAICRALLPGPALILADEATGNLDPPNKSRILDLLIGTAQQHGAGLVAVTHDHALLKRFERTIDFQRFQELLGEE